jgi:hypothetical protein|tara:strand:+ start:130 stop:483 length:354 start_codon:yes stop_codon:yes gene_type:complete
MDEEEIKRQLREHFNEQMENIVREVVLGNPEATKIFTKDKNEIEYVQKNIASKMNGAIKMCFPDDNEIGELMDYTRRVYEVLDSIGDRQEQELFLACCTLVITIESIIASSVRVVVA